MTFKKYWQTRTPSRKREIAENCDTTVNYLHQIAGSRDAGKHLALLIYNECGGLVSMRSLGVKK